MQVIHTFFDKARYLKNELKPWRCRRCRDATRFAMEPRDVALDRKGVELCLFRAEAKTHRFVTTQVTDERLIIHK